MVLKGDTSLKGALAALDASLTLRLKADLKTTGELLLAAARQARINRDLAVVESISDWVTTYLPDTAFAESARYQKAYCLHKRGGTPEARLLLERAVELASPAYKPRTILTLAGTYLDTGHINEAEPMFREALRASQGSDALSDLQTLRNLAITSAMRGDHRVALSLLVSLVPTAQALGTLYPADFLSHLNSLAIELGEVGRVDEANRVIDSVLRSQLAKNRPQWHHTKTELATKPRLCFAPFALALGYPVPPAVELVEQEPEQLEVPPKADPSATFVNRSASAASETLQKLKLFRRRNPPRASLLCGLPGRASRTTTRNPGHLRSKPGAESEKQGYAVSPPARAPPSSDQNRL
ncbi:MAG TPA: tetratricopeptide repeat protein [Blastocatellia bacterium]|nr:tetratricopeptide repeat protein [Blastocatellia bacterium]